MRICVFTYEFLPVVGGVQVVSAMLAAAWKAAGHEVVMVTRTPPDPDPDYDRRLPYPVVRLSPDKPQAKRRWKPILDQTDLIVCHNVSLTYWPIWFLRRKKIVFVHHLFLGQEPTREQPVRERIRWALRLWMRGAIIRRAAGNVFITDYIRQCVGFPDGAVINNPIDEMFLPLSDVQLTSDFAYFGRMSFEKGVTDLLDALHLCNTKGHRFTLDLYGDGHMIKDFQDHAVQLQLDGQVRWKPFVRGDDLVRAMNSAAVVVMPSKWIEPMGITAVEAMACGKCVIGSSGGGLGEVLQGYCPTYPNHGIEQLALQMIAVMTDPDLRKRYEAAALRRAKDYQRLDEIAAVYLNYFRKVTG